MLLIFHYQSLDSQSLDSQSLDSQSLHSLSLHPLPAGGLLFDGGADGGLFASGKWCRLQHSKVNIIGAITKLISFSVATVCGASLAGPLIQEGIGAPPRSNFAAAVLPAVSSRWCIAALLLPSVSSRWHPTASNIFQIALRHSAPASNKPHLTEKSTPVWLAIWRTWAGFANSQHRNAAFATPNNISAHSSLLPHWAAAQT